MMAGPWLPPIWYRLLDRWCLMAIMDRMAMAGGHCHLVIATSLHPPVLISGWWQWLLVTLLLAKQSWLVHVNATNYQLIVLVGVLVGVLDYWCLMALAPGHWSLVTGTSCHFFHHIPTLHSNHRWLCLVIATQEHYYQLLDIWCSLMAMTAGHSCHFHAHSHTSLCIEMMEMTVMVALGTWMGPTHTIIVPLHHHS